MIFGSVCSGIEAASVAWTPLGWRCAWVSDIEPFACALLSHHYPDLPNLGDMTRILEHEDLTAVDVLVGGTPCQSFSVAGLGAGLDDPRGQLAIEFARIARTLRPRWVVWENVPGVFAPAGLPRERQWEAFSDILAALTGHSGRFKPAGGRWSRHRTGIIPPAHRDAYGVAWRVLDAQYVRVESHPRALPQRRERVFLVGYLGDWRPPAAVHLEREALSRNDRPVRTSQASVAGIWLARLGTSGADITDAENNRLIPTVAGPLRARDDKSPGEDSLGMHIVPAVTGALCYDRKAAGSATNQAARQGQVIPIAVNTRQDPITLEGCALPLDCRAPTQAVTISREQITSAHNRSNPKSGDPCHTLPGSGEAAILVEPNALRRLTPREHERLQGFPDDYTLIPYRGKPARDAPRYRALGNSMAVNCVRLIGERIQMVENILKAKAS